MSNAAPHNGYVCDSTWMYYSRRAMEQVLSQYEAFQQSNDSTDIREAVLLRGFTGRPRLKAPWVYHANTPVPHI